MTTARLIFLSVILAWCLAPSAGGQGPSASGGPLDPLQAAFDVQHYELVLAVDPSQQSIGGTLTATLLTVAPLSSVRLHLDQALRVNAAEEAGKSLPFTHEEGLITVDLGRERASGETLVIKIAYAGKPRVAKNPPWDGGFTWATTKAGEPWVATSCQGEGADLWWPCKDHPSDEPAGFDLHISVPKPLVVASNGKLVKTTEKGSERTFHWRVTTPINNYGIALNIAPYVLIEDKLASVAGDTFPVVFYALPESEKKARKFLPEVKDHVHWFERNFGPYPFRGDKYGVAETPHLGMEHQTIIAYGNKFARDRHDYDWLHHHELSHEWWGNLVTARDWNDFWIHEGIGTYTQALYIEDLRGQDAYHQEMKKYRLTISGAKALAPREPKTTAQMYKGDNDLYYRGAWILHSLRSVIGRDALMLGLKRLAYPEEALEKKLGSDTCRFATTDDFTAAMEKASGRKLDWFVEVYLRSPGLPRLKERQVGGKLILNWVAPNDLPFPMPIDVRVGKKLVRLDMTDGRGELVVPEGAEVLIDPENWVLRGKKVKDGE